MIAVIILILVCASRILLSLRPQKDPYWQEDLQAELVYSLEDDGNGNKWLAKLVLEDEVFYIIVNASKEHQLHDVIDVQSTDTNYELLVYEELSK